jgi:hypothetical protein
MVEEVPAVPDPPEAHEPDQNDPLFPLWKGTQQALLALPAYFQTEIQIQGMRATDLHTLGAPVGATIEEQVVKTLNGMRDVWDPEGDFQLYYFVRQPQTFPDVLLRSREQDAHNTVLGIELKSWYLLSKERDPSYRFKATAAAATDWDLLCVVPWHLTNVTSGTPNVLTPFLVPARYGALYRNHHWLHVRRARGEPGDIVIPEGIEPYPVRGDHIHDSATHDGGGNFGRLARSGLMDAYMDQTDEETLSGIPASDWRTFFKNFE